MKRYNWEILVCVILMNFVSLHGRNTDKYFRTSKSNKDASEETKQILTKAINKLFGDDNKENSKDVKYHRLNSRPDLKKRIVRPNQYGLDALQRPTHLLEAEGSQTGNVLKPLVDFRSRDEVASNQNFGDVEIKSGKPHPTIIYEEFRDPNDLMEVTQSLASLYKNKNPLLIVIEIEPSELDAIKNAVSNDLFKNQVSDEDDTASEIMDQFTDDSEEDSNEYNDFRRKSKKKYRVRKKDEVKSPSKNCTSKSISSSSSSSEIEKNEGNPFTIHKNAYKQNWMWNYKLDGTHMNINPFAPKLAEAGPTGADIFFMRKWWYFNQDDYKPLGRRSFKDKYKQNEERKSHNLI